jgi:hypothetical protein
MVERHASNASAQPAGDLHPPTSGRSQTHSAATISASWPGQDGSDSRFWRRPERFGIGEENGNTFR